MANFCRQCGRPLENGRCPVCDGPVEAPSASPVQASSGALFFSTLAGDLKALLASRDPFRIAPAAGFVLLALLSLLDAFLSLSDGVSYDVYLVLTCLETVGLIAVGVGGVGVVKNSAPEGPALVLGCVSTLLGFTGVLNLLSLVVNHYASLSYLTPCLFLLALGLALTAKDQFFRLLCLGGTGALALILLIQAFTTLPFLPHLVLCYCALCAALPLVKSHTLL